MFGWRLKYWKEQTVEPICAVPDQRAGAMYHNGVWGLWIDDDDNDFQ